MNQLVPQNNTALAAADDYYARLAAEAQSYKGGGDGHAFLKFNGNDGYYTYGAEDNELPNGTEVAVNMRSFKRGWICWMGGQPKEEIMLSIEEGQPPQKYELTDHSDGKGYAEGDGWQEQKTIEFKTLDETALTLLFQANNASKMRALEALMKDFARNFMSHPGAVPITTLDANEFEAKPRDGGRKVKKWAPKFAIHAWVSEADLLALSQGSEDDYDPNAEYDEDGNLLTGPADGEAEYVEEPVVEEPAPEPARPVGGRRPAPTNAGTPRAASAAAPAAAPAPTRPVSAPAPAARTAPPGRPAAAPAAAAPAGGAPRPSRRF